tara:strand:+ start:228 stop:371 length:144 start_codon:yes stop_codon:yes gene_type:complete
VFCGRLKEICPCDETALLEVGGILNDATETFSMLDEKYSKYEGYDIL